MQHQVTSESQGPSCRCTGPLCGGARSAWTRRHRAFVVRWDDSGHVTLFFPGTDAVVEPCSA